jgi:hypothetical protein
MRKVALLLLAFAAGVGVGWALRSRSARAARDFWTVEAPVDSNFNKRHPPGSPAVPVTP